MNDYIKRHLEKFHPIREIQNFIITQRPYKEVTDFETIILTEFNWGTNSKGIEEGYLEQRFRLFDKYTFPSVNAQTDKDFVWFLYLNSKTPQRFKEMIGEYQKQATMRQMILAYVDSSGGRPSFGYVVRNNYKFNKKWLMTLRCDNDDILANNYIEEIKKNFRPVNNMYIDLIRGYNLNDKTGELNAYKCRSCHFLGYVENTKERIFETVHNQDHSLAKNFGWMRRVDNKSYPLWCEVVHETNRVNSFRGEKATDKEINYFENNFTYKRNQSIEENFGKG